MKNVFYRVSEWDSRTRIVQVEDDVNIRRDREAQTVAEKCADDFYWHGLPRANRGGWPFVIELICEDTGKVVSAWEVDAEECPRFYAEKTK